MEDILKAINDDEINTIVDILSANPDIDLNINAGRQTMEIPIHLAARKYNKEVLESLLIHGADIDIKDEEKRREEGKSALEYLVRDDDYEQSLPMIEFFVTKGADIEKAFRHAFYKDKFEIVRILMKKYNKDVVMDWDYTRDILGNDMDFDILEYFIGAQDFVFQNVSNSFCEYNGSYKTLSQFVEKKSWESAMRYILIHSSSDIDNGHTLDGVVDNKTGIIETILENLTDFSYVDPDGTKFVNVILNECLYPQLFKQIDGNVVKKLLEAGANENILNEKLHCYLGSDDFEIDTTKKFIETGVDLNIPVNHNGEEIRLCDVVYMVSALHGHFELVEDMMAKGANIACILMSKEIEKMFSDFHEDRVQFVFDKLSANGILKDKNTKMGPKSEPLVDFFKSHGKEEVLVKIGLLAKPPKGMTVTHFGISACVSWEPEQGPEDFPVTGYRIEYRQEYRKGGWEEVGTIEGQETSKYKMSGLENNDEVMFRVSPKNREDPDDYRVTITSYQIEFLRQCRNGGWEEVGTLAGQQASKFKVYGLENNDKVMFRVSARNDYGLSAPVEEPGLHTVLVLPSPPGQPKHEVIGEDITITWAPPAEGGYRALTKYRVEGGNKGQDWRILGTISSGREKQWMRKMEIFDFKQLNFNLVRVIAVNGDGESEPSDPSVEIKPSPYLLS